MPGILWLPKLEYSLWIFKKKVFLSWRRRDSIDSGTFVLDKTYQTPPCALRLNVLFGLVISIIKIVRIITGRALEGVVLFGCLKKVNETPLRSDLRLLFSAVFTINSFPSLDQFYLALG